MSNRMSLLEFEFKLYRRLAQVSIGPSSIRNQGGSGLIDILRGYFEKEIDPKEFFKVLKSKRRYQNFLDRHTISILKRFPRGAKSWGAARKGLNLFLRDLVYNGYFSTKFRIPGEYSRLNEFVKHMEVPLDRDVVTGIQRDSENELPRWTGIKNLTPDVSNLFQQQAEVIASKRKTARIHLDLLYWREIKK